MPGKGCLWPTSLHNTRSKSRALEDNSTLTKCPSYISILLVSERSPPTHKNTEHQQLLASESKFSSLSPLPGAFRFHIDPSTAATASKAHGSRIDPVARPLGENLRLRDVRIDGRLRGRHGVFGEEPVSEAERSRSTAESCWLRVGRWLGWVMGA